MEKATEEKEVGVGAKPNFRTHSEATAIEPVHYWQEGGWTHRSIEQNRMCRNRAVRARGRLIFDRDAKVVE